MLISNIHVPVPICQQRKKGVTNVPKNPSGFLAFDEKTEYRRKREEEKEREGEGRKERERREKRVKMMKEEGMREGRRKK